MLNAKDIRRKADEATAHDRELIEAIFPIVDLDIETAASKGEYSLSKAYHNLWPEKLVNVDKALDTFTDHYSRLGFKTSIDYGDFLVVETYVGKEYITQDGKCEVEDRQIPILPKGAQYTGKYVLFVNISW